jgi:hypothetical protein
MRPLLIIIAFLVICNVGCGLVDSHVKQMDVLNGMATQAAESLKSGAITSIHASGQGLNPGITVEAAIVYRATARYEGLAGQFSIAQQGEKGEVTPAQQATIDSVYRDKAIRSGEVRHAIIDDTGKIVGYFTGASTQPSK